MKFLTTWLFAALALILVLLVGLAFRFASDTYGPIGLALAFVVASLALALVVERAA